MDILDGLSAGTRVRGVLVSILLISCAMAMISCNKTVPEGAAATVNGRPIYYTEIDSTYKSQFPAQGEGENEDQIQLRREEILGSLIDAEIMFQRAEKASLVATDADVTARLNEMKAPYTTEEFDKQLKDWGITLDQLKEHIRKDESVKKLFNKEISSKISISDADVTKFYNDNRNSFNLAEPQVHMAQILVTPSVDPNVHNLKNDKAKNDAEARQKIQAIESRLKQGEDFAMVAQNYSEDPQSSPNGGDLGFIPESALDKSSPELKRLVLAMRPGTISPILPSPDGYRILKVISNEPAGQRELGDPRVQQTIRETLLSRKDQLLKAAYYSIARNEAKVVDYMASRIFNGDTKK
jgi:peptidyl-prolyl cis-trans isomerase SurA